MDAETKNRRLTRKQKELISRNFAKPSDGTRTVDPLLTIRVATHGNGFGLFSPFPGPVHLPPVATGCDR